MAQEYHGPDCHGPDCHGPDCHGPDCHGPVHTWPGTHGPVHTWPGTPHGPVHHGTPPRVHHCTAPLHPAMAPALPYTTVAMPELISTFTGFPFTIYLESYSTSIDSFIDSFIDSLLTQSHDPFDLPFTLESSLIARDELAIKWCYGL